MKALMSWGGLALVLVLFVAFNVLTGAMITRSRIDLTENKLYTLSQGTKNIVAGLQEPIRLRFYFSKSLAGDEASGIVPYAGRVRDLLDTYASNSNGKILLEVFDPDPYSETEDRAVASGLKGVPANASGEKLYFGLVGSNETGQEEIIEFFQPSREDSLEYDITKLVYNLSHPKKPVVGVLTTLNMDGNPMARMMNPRAPQDPWVAMDVLRESFDVRTIPPSSETLDADLDVLVIAHPQNLSQSLLYAIDQFVMGGGKVVAFVDPYCLVQEVPQDPQNRMAAMMADRTSTLGVLGESWGIEMSKDEVAGDRELAIRQQAADGQVIDMVHYLGLTDEKGCFDEQDFATSQLQVMNLITAGILKQRDGATTTFTPIIQTTKSSMRIQKSRIQFLGDPKELLESFQSGGERLTLAARINGPAKTAFPDGKPKKEGADPKEAEPDTSLKESKEPINVIVVADADMLTDGVWVRVQNLFGSRFPMPFAGNGAFLVNAVENLSGSNDLISLRTRGRSVRPFDKVVELRREAEAQFRQKEKDLEAKLRDAEQKINELQGNKEADSALILSPEVRAEIQRFREEEKKTRVELRRVKHELNRETKALKLRLVLANGFAIPVVVLAAGCAVWFVRRSKMKVAREKFTRS